MVGAYRKILENIHEKALQCGRDPNEIKLISVSKDSPVDLIQTIYQQGARDFGESRVLEALDKIPLLPYDCRWHFIGTLQSKKVTKVISAFALIHSVDTLELAMKISQASEKKGIITPILLQVNTSKEASKHGLYADEWEKKLEAVNELSHIKIEGLMTMAPLTEDQPIIRHCFKKLSQLREKWRSHMKNPSSFQHLSMGMSHDYLIAIEEGATLLRIGSAIFSSR